MSHSRDRSSAHKNPDLGHTIGTVGQKWEIDQDPGQMVQTEIAVCRLTHFLKIQMYMKKDRLKIKTINKTHFEL